MTLTANPDSATTPAGTAVTVAVLANDTLDGSPVALGDLTGPPTIVAPPAQGTAVVQPDGTITYTPPAGFCGQVTFEYQIESPDGACLCVENGEGIAIYAGVPDTFDRGLPLAVRYAGACRTFHYYDGAWTSAGEGAEDCSDDLNEIPPGVTVTLSQGEQSGQMTTCTMAASWMANAPDGSWWGPTGDVGDTLVLTFDGIDYPATHDGAGWAFTDDEPPVPFTATAWDALVVNQYEQDPVHYCGAIARQCFVYANNEEAWGGSGNASTLYRAGIGNIPVWLADAFDNDEGIEITFEGETEATYYETAGAEAYRVGGPNPSGPVSGVALVVSSVTGEESSCLSYYIPEGS